MAHLTPCKQIVFTSSASSRVTFGLVEGQRLYKVVDKRGRFWCYKFMCGRYQHITTGDDLQAAMTLCRLDNNK